ncbi:MAG TPA: signal peptidase II [Nannocystis exedens]|nr:signal peptidase II [Nannocystis exedens]
MNLTCILLRMAAPLVTPRQRLGWFSFAALVGGGLDLLTKAWAVAKLRDLPGKTIAIVDPWLDFTLTYNRGTAFSLIRDLSASRLLFGLLALLTILVLLGALLRWQSPRSEALALGALAGGALGNGLDRVIRMAPGGGTGVVDFVKLNYPWGGSWPVFNLADVLVALGVAYFVLRSLRGSKRTTSPTTDKTPETASTGPMPELG